jgi:hypothetical protein
MIPAVNLLAFQSLDAKASTGAHLDDRGRPDVLCPQTIMPSRPPSFEFGWDSAGTSESSDDWIRGEIARLPIMTMSGAGGLFAII